MQAPVPNGLKTSELDAELRLQAPINLARAYDVMEQEGLEGIIVGEPLNVFHFTGYWPQIGRTKMGHPPTTFVLLSRDKRLMPGLVASKFIFYYTFTDSGFAQPYQTYLYRGPGDSGVVLAEPEMPEPTEFADREQAPLSDVEMRRRTLLTEATDQRHVQRDAGAALVAAMRDLGMWQGKIAYDNAVIAAVCEHHERPGRIVPADNILRKIRMIKSPLEIQLMRRASWSNVDAVQATAKMIREGMTYPELRQIYYEEAIARENLPVFLTVDRVSAQLADFKIADGQAFFIDGVSHFQNYHGDYARTIFVGEPTAPMKRAAAAVTLGWTSVRERLRPGLRYSEIYALGQDAVRKGGYDFTIGFGPHSVGLSHTDEPAIDNGGFYTKDDLVLQENMILSVDCPILDTGLGGSAHLEDLMLITHDGAEPIHPMSSSIIIV